MTYYLLGLIVLALLLLGARRYVAANPRNLAALVRKAGGIGALALAAVMALTGRWPVAVPLAFLGMLLLLRRGPFAPVGGPDRTPGRVSSVRTAFLEMVLDHDTGSMNGRVLAGAFAGRELKGLSQAELLELWQECRAGEPQSRQLLEAYLDRTWENWREAVQQQNEAGRTGNRRGERANGRPAASTRMTADEALDILGLAAGATPDEIRAAHRRLMKRFHPDQGGSTYLAAKINEAKDVLLGRQ
jgi:hypothetical protein